MTIRKKFTRIFPASKNIPPALEELSPTYRQRVSPITFKSHVITKGRTMASGDLVRHVVTVMLYEGALTEINELNNHLTHDDFLFTMIDDDGNIHELRTNTLGLVSTQSEGKTEGLVSGPTHSATGKDLGITIMI